MSSDILQGMQIGFSGGMGGGQQPPGGGQQSGGMPLLQMQNLLGQKLGMIPSGAGQPGAPSGGKPGGAPSGGKPGGAPPNLLGGAAPTPPPRPPGIGNPASPSPYGTWNSYLKTHPNDLAGAQTAVDHQQDDQQDKGDTPSAAPSRAAGQAHLDAMRSPTSGAGAPPWTNSRVNPDGSLRPYNAATDGPAPAGYGGGGGKGDVNPLVSLRSGVAPPAAATPPTSAPVTPARPDRAAREQAGRDYWQKAIDVPAGTSATLDPAQAALVARDRAPTPPPRPPGIGVPRAPGQAGNAPSSWPAARNQTAGPGAPSNLTPPLRPLSDKPATPLPPRTPTGSGSGPAAPPSTAPAAPTTGGYKSQAPGTIGAVDTTLRNGGFSANAVAGIMGNINQESNFDSRLGTTGGDKGASHGLGQWNGARLTDLKNFAARNKLNPDDPVTQAKFMINEADRRSPGLTARMNAAKSPAEAARIWSDVYESPKKGPTENMSGRQSYAENFAKGHYGKPGLMNRGGGSGGGDTPSGGGGTFKMPDSKAKDDLTAAKGPDLSTGQQTAEQKKKQEQAGKGGKIDAAEAKNYVEVSQLAKPVENILAQRAAQDQQDRDEKQKTSKTFAEMFAALG